MSGSRSSSAKKSFRELIAFLDRIDLLKFAPSGPTTMPESSRSCSTTWETRVTTLDARIRVKPRARQRSADGRSKPSARGTQPIPTLPNGKRR